MTQLNHAPPRLRPADERFEQRRLAGAVGPDDADPLAAIQRLSKLTHQRLRIAISQLYPVDAHTLFAAPMLGRGKAQSDPPRLFPAITVPVHTLQLVQLLAPRLGLLGLLPGDVFANEVFGARNLALLTLIHGHQLRMPLVARNQILLIVARIANQLAVLDVDDLVTHRL